MFQSWWRNLTKKLDPKVNFPKKRKNRRSGTRKHAAHASSHPLVLEQLEARLVPTYLSLVPATNQGARASVITEMVNVNNLMGTAGNEGLYSGNIVIVYNAAVLNASAADVSITSQFAATVGVSATTTASAPFPDLLNPNGTVVTLAELDISLGGKANSGNTGYVGTSGGNLLQINFHVNTAAPFAAQSVVNLAADDLALADGNIAGPINSPTELTATVGSGPDSPGTNYALTYPNSAQLTFGSAPVTGETFALTVTSSSLNGGTPETITGITYSATPATLATNIQNALSAATPSITSTVTPTATPIVTITGLGTGVTATVTADATDGGSAPNPISTSGGTVSASNTEPVDAYNASAGPGATVAAGPQDATLTVNGTDHPPVAVNDLYNVVPGQTMTVNGNTASPDNGVLANDTDVDINQTVNFNGATDGTFELTYTPAGGSTVTTGPITYSTTLSTLQSNVAAAVAGVINGGTSPSNLVVTGTTSAVTIAFQNSLAGTPMGTLAVATRYTENNLNYSGANPSITEGGDYPPTLLATLVSLPSDASGPGGSFTFDANGDGGFTYTPNTGFVGKDTFTYVTTDTSGQVSNTATVTITVGTTVSIPQTGLSVAGTAGNTVVVPVNIDNPDPAGSTGLYGVDLEVNFDPTVFAIGQPPDPNGDGGSSYSIYNGPDSPNYSGGNPLFALSGITATVDNTTGEIGIAIEGGASETNNTQGNSDTTGGALVDITFTVLPGAPVGNTVINLAATNQPGGPLAGSKETVLNVNGGPGFTLYPTPANFNGPVAATWGSTPAVLQSNVYGDGTANFYINSADWSGAIPNGSTITVTDSTTPADGGTFVVSGITSASGVYDLAGTYSSWVAPATADAVSYSWVPASGAITPAADDGLVMVTGAPAFTGVSAAASPATVGVSYGFQYTASARRRRRSTCSRGRCRAG